MLSISQAIDIINNRRSAAELKLFQTLNQLRKDELFSQAERKVRELSFEIAKREAQNADLGDLNSLLDENKKIYAERLTKLGFSQTDTEVQYSCPKCKDTGFVNGEQCVCLKNLIMHDLRSNYRPETDIDSFNKINLEVYDEEFKKGYKNTFLQLKKYTEKFPKVIPFLLLLGSTGVGKSYMASVISNTLTKKGFSSLYLNACELNDIFLKYHLADIEKKSGIFSPLTDCDLLIIDDLGSENIYKNVTVPYLYTLILRRKNKNTIITTNLTHNEIDERYERRISSRLADINFTINVSINGNDLRLKNRK